VISCKRIKRIKLVKALIVAESQIYESSALKTTLCKRRTRIKLVIALIVAASHILPIFGFKSNLMQRRKRSRLLKAQIVAALSPTCRERRRKKNPKH
jgi:hypothetical protein